MGVADHVQHAGRVADGPGDRSVDRAASPCLPGDRPLAHPAAGGLEPDQPALARRDADGAAAVVGVRHRHHARCHRGGRPAGRAAGRVTGIPRVARRGEAPRLGGDRGAELRHVGPAQRHEAGRPELLRQIGRNRERQVAQRPDPECRRLALDRAPQVLEQDRDATEGAVGQVALCLKPRRVEPGPDHGVQLRIDRLDPGDGRLYQLPGTHLTAPDKVCLRGGIQPRCIDHTGNATSRTRRRDSRWHGHCRPRPSRHPPAADVPAGIPRMRLSWPWSMSGDVTRRRGRRRW